MRSDAIKPGDVIAGKYRVRAILSRNRGYLVEAFHTEFDQRVVLRVLSPHLVEDKEVERFRRESRVLAKLESEHVARIVDVGRTQDGAFFFARQYLEGQDLGSYLKQRGPLPLADAVLYLLQAAEAVAETHVHSIILRELQPAHLFVTQRIGGQQIKIIDFGTAKLMRDAAAPNAGGELTATAMFGLSPFSSPELVRKAQHVDVRTDVWSLGAIFYQLLTGRPPFVGEMAALMLAITRDEPVPPSQYRRDLPPEIDSIVAWCLAKDPDGRFANVYGFAHALLPFATAEGQILVKRIGEITTAGKQRRAQPAPIPMDAGVDDDDDDNPRTAYRPVDAPAVRPDYRANVVPADAGTPTAMRGPPPGPPPLAGRSPSDEVANLDRTLFVTEEPAPQAQGRRSVPPMYAGAASGAAPPRAMLPTAPLGAESPQGHPGRPAWQPMPVPLPPGSNPGQPGLAPAGAAGGDANRTLPLDMAPLPLDQRLDQRMVPPSARQPPPSAKQTIQSSAANIYGAPKKPPPAQKVALAAVAGAVVLLTVVAVVVVFKGHSTPDATADTGSAAASASAAPASNAGAVVSASAAPAVTATAVAPAATSSAAPVAPPPAAETSAPALPSGGSHVAAAPLSWGKGPLKGKPEPVATPATTQTAAAAGGGDNGTLVAVAVGGSCAFSVNGASKGTTSTLKLSVKPGTYSVTCAPSSGSSKSKSVTVTSGGTAMAMFKL